MKTNATEEMERELWELAERRGPGGGKCEDCNGELHTLCYAGHWKEPYYSRKFSFRVLCYLCFDDVMNIHAAELPRKRKRPQTGGDAKDAVKSVQAAVGHLPSWRRAESQGNLSPEAARFIAHALRPVVKFKEHLERKYAVKGTEE